MSAVALNVELKLRDGQRQKISVQVQNNLSSLIRGVSELHVNASQLLSALVEQDQVHGEPGDEDEDSDEEERSEATPPAKRSRTTTDTYG